MPDIMQHEARQNYTFHDQHGRAWLAIVDTRTKPHLAPCVEPWPQFEAPILPRGTLLAPNPSQLGRLDIAYGAWLEQAEAQERTYRDTVEALAVQMFGDQATRAMQERNPRLLAAAGPAPVSPTFIQAAAAGNKWVLGLVPSDQVPTWAQAILDTLPQYRPALSPAVDGRSAFPDLADELEDGDLVAVGAEGEDDAFLSPDGTLPPVKRGRGRPRKEG
jgi:hypothetical protein